MLGLAGLATGIGSLPHKEAAAALDLVFKCCPEIPFWPQLPKRDIREGMLTQFSEGFPCLQIGAGGVVFDAADKEKKLEEFYAHLISPPADCLSDPFRISEVYARGLYAFRQRLQYDGLDKVKYLKCHITGPFTFAASLKDERGVALLHDRVFMQAIIEGLARKALWQIAFLNEFDKDCIVFVDEPYLGSFGSAYTTINREEVVAALSDLLQKIKSSGRVLTGVHCCGNTDWSMLTEVKELDIINFDAYAFLDKFILYSRDLGSFLKRGGIICWGIVPTQEYGGEAAGFLADRLRGALAALAEKGADKDLILNNLLLSPACGLGALSVEKAEAIFSALVGLSSLARENKII